MSELFLDRPAERAVFAPDKMGKASLYHGDQAMVGLNAFEARQRHELHHHEGVDKIYLVLEGHGEFVVGETKRAVPAGGLVVAPAGVPHAVHNEGPGKLIVLVIMAPPPRK